MNKPDWKDAPEWARYLAMDYDNQWYWYECKPYKNNFERWEPSAGKNRCANTLSDDWADSLEARPE